MFLSPDNYVQAPDYTQNFNRYGYAFNNPLMYVDPTGEFLNPAIIPIISTIAGGYIGGVTANNFKFNPVNWNWDSPSTWIGIVQGGIGGYGIGQGIQNRIEYKNSLTSFYDTPYGIPAEYGSIPIEGRGYGMSYDGFDIYNSSFNNFPDPPDDIISMLDAAPKRDFSGFWGSINYFLTGGYVDGYAYNRSGDAIGFAPYMGMPPTPGIGKIGTYAKLAKMTRGYKGAIQAHHLVEVRHLRRLMMSTKDAPAVILTKADHAKMTAVLRKLLPYGKNISYTTDEIINAYKKAYGNYPEWVELVVKFLQ